MPVEYKCQTCQAIGDLDSFVNQIECPNCGGVMTPAATPPPPQPPPAAASEGIDEGETPTTIVPRSEILKEMAATSDQPRKVVKVAKIVNIGFGGMLTTSATRGFKPITPGRKDAGLPFSQQSSFPQQPQTQPPPPEKEAIPGEPTAKKQVSSSSTSLGSQRKKPFTVSKFKISAFSPHQTSTQNMDSTQIDPGIALSNQQQQVRLKRKQAVQPQEENPPASQEILPKPRISGLTSTSTSLKFLPKGAMKVAQTHTSIQHSQTPPPELQSQPQSPLQTQQQTTRQYAQQSSRFPDQDEDFTEQVRIAAERQEAILREAYRIAEGKILKEREETEKSSAQKKAREEEDVQAKKHAEKTEQAARIAKELAETEELIRKELETLELRKKELREIRKSAEEETAKAKTQDSKIILLSSQKHVKLKSGEGAESLMRSSKNLQIDKAMLETGKLALRKEELEKKDSKSDAANKDRKEDTDKSIVSDIGKAPAKGRTPTKVGINADAPMTNSTLVKIQQKKKTVILFIVGVTVAAICLLIILFGGTMTRNLISLFSPSPAAVPPDPTQAPYDIQSNTNTDSSLRTEYNTVYQKIKKNPANKQEIDDNIRELQAFIDGHQNSPDTDKYIKNAKENIRTMQDTKELY
ncbi:MAG: hypothetical protein NT118_15685 [Lentisphaerae bacterium]|nr:hypothetical protein [Lentisphaerota bacterium]